MPVNPVFRSSPTRLMGLSSGMDTESIISATLRMHQFKIDNQMRNKQIIEWKQKIHNDVKDQITNIRHTYLSNLGSKTLMNRNAFNTNKATATTADGKVSSAVTISTSSNSSLGSFKITSVESLAKGSSISSSSTVSPNGTGFNPSDKLGNLALTNGGITFDTADKADVRGTDGKMTTVTKADIAGASWEYMGSEGIIYGDNEIYITKNEHGDFVAKGKGLKEADNGEAVLSFSGDTAELELEDGSKISFTRTGNKLDVSVVDDNDDPVTGYTDKTLGFTETATINGAKLVRNDGDNSTVRDNSGKLLDYYGEASFDITDGKGNTTSITLKSNMSISDMVNTVNNSGADVTMAYDRMQDKFTIQNKKVGDSELIITDTSGNAANKLFGDYDTGTSIVSDNGTMAKIYIEGLVNPLESDTNTFSFRGVTIKANEVTDQAITVKVERNVDDAVNSIKDFLDSYNSLIKKLEDMLNERKRGSEVSYKPLTDEEKSVMSEKQIEEWEAIAKKGIMRDDRGIESLVSNLRSTFFKEIEGTGMTASQLGLTTGPYVGGTGGQIILNEDKLRAALEEDPDKVADVFLKFNESGDGVGLLHKIDGLLYEYTKTGGTQNNTLDALEKSMKELNDRIMKMEEKMWADEDRLYRQFAAMETALSQMQSQGDWFNAMLGG